MRYKQSDRETVPTVEVLVATMHQIDLSKYEEMHIQTDAVITNQADEYGYSESLINGKTARMVTTPARGLSRNRNLAMLYASGDICVIADDDIIYIDGYERGIVRAYDELPDADIIFFNVKSRASDREIKHISKAHRVGRYQTYPSFCITYKRESVLKNDIWFPYLLGSGSIFAFGEESNFINRAKKKGMRIYAHPFKMAEVKHETSLWFAGFNEKYFFNVGAFLAATYPTHKWLFMQYYLFKLGKKTELAPGKMIKSMLSGMKAYKMRLSYDEWKKRIPD